MKKLLILACAAAIGFAANAATIDLSAVTADTTIDDGTTLTGTLNSNVKVSIAHGATVTLSGATINGVDNYDYKWAGISCIGDATIVLQGNNTVKGFYYNYPGIYVPAGYTLTIKGDGSLDASSNGLGAGIGGGFQYSCGNIAIENGTITATGGLDAAGIGGGAYAYVGNIAISGGTITATGDRAGIGCGSYGGVCNILISGGSIVATGGVGAGIGGGYTSQCGGIFISGGTIEANGGGGGPGIGSGASASCGVISISGGDVTATAGEGFCGAGIGSGDSGSCGRIYVESGITRIVASADYGSPIGAARNGTCGAVSVDDSLDDTTSGSTRTITSKVVNLANVTEGTTVADGRILTGTLAANVELTIADGATVTLRDATINGVHDGNCEWAGLTCEGNATIILEGSNTVKGFYENYPGINVPVGSTLTIKGNGSLDASSNGWGAGIGGGYEYSCGSIVIEGGTITATGGESAAGVGGGYGTVCGDITITGGSVVATGGGYAAGVGGGNNSTCGDILLTSGSVVATGGEYAAGVGGGNSSICGDITITKGVTSVTATKGTYAPNSIGAGNSGTCGTVTIGGVVGEISESPYTYMPNLDLTSVTADMILTGGCTLTGTLSANVKVSIADGATVTLRDATINGVNNSNYDWAGITCEGNATIILEGSNTVKGFYEDYPGIYVPVGSTLTIKGDGSLDASSNGWGAGIGGGCFISCGNIKIEGGTVTATGGHNASGIGVGQSANCGDITITKGVTSVTATKGTGAPNSIGVGFNNSSTCGTVTIGGVVTGNISESPYTYVPTRINLAVQTENYTAADGDVLYGETEYAVTVPGGASVMINGVEVAGAGTANPAPTFSADGKAATTEFVQGADGKWTLTTFAELGNDAIGADVADSQIKVYAASTVEGLESASPMASGVEVKEKKSAVKTTIEVTPPEGESQFFKVKFGE